MNNCLTYSLKDVSVLLGISYSTVYNLALNGDLPCFKIGGQYFVSRDSFNSWFDSLSKGGVQL